MAQNRKEEAQEIHRVDTVPPPPDSDAYSAPTKVGEIAAATWNAMLMNRDVPAPVAPPPATSSKTPTGPAPTAELVQGSASSSPPNSVPQIYADEDEDNQATLLHPAAKRFVVPEPTPPPVSAAMPRPTPPAPAPPPVVPQMAAASTDAAAWPFAPALVSSPTASAPTSNEMKRAVLLGVASFVVALLVFAAIVWLWL
jgi:hypothetical protein